jgi:hypothetical protein
LIILSFWFAKLLSSSPANSSSSINLNFSPWFWFVRDWKLLFFSFCLSFICYRNSNKPDVIIMNRIYRVFHKTWGLTKLVHA